MNLNNAQIFLNQQVRRQVIFANSGILYPKSVINPLSIYTYHYFIKRQVFEYTNDFAHWAGESLEERALSEHLSNIDPLMRDVFKILRGKGINIRIGGNAEAEYYLKNQER